LHVFSHEVAHVFFRTAFHGVFTVFHGVFFARSFTVFFSHEVAQGFCTRLHKVFFARCFTEFSRCFFTPKNPVNQVFALAKKSCQSINPCKSCLKIARFSHEVAQDFFRTAFHGVFTVFHGVFFARFFSHEVAQSFHSVSQVFFHTSFHRVFTAFHGVFFARHFTKLHKVFFAWYFVGFSQRFIMQSGFLTPLKYVFHRTFFQQYFIQKSLHSLRIVGFFC
jgi:hypothetical protein